MNPSAAVVVDDTRRWLERAVIGLNLCPFAKAVHVKNQVHFAVSAATHPRELLDDLAREVDALLALEPAARETTLLVAPDCCGDLLDFNDLLGQADRLIRKRRLDGVIQVASFHPAYQFEGTDAGDITNCTNRSPYPTLHILREASIDRAVAAYPQAEAIYEANKLALRRLGEQGWADLGVGRSS